MCCSARRFLWVAHKLRRGKSSQTHFHTRIFSQRVPKGNVSVLKPVRSLNVRLKWLKTMGVFECICNYVCVCVCAENDYRDAIKHIRVINKTPPFVSLLANNTTPWIPCSKRKGEFTPVSGEFLDFLGCRFLFWKGAKRGLTPKCGRS